MRLLKNTVNEFVVFRDRIFSGDGRNLDLDETKLFAMMLYKGTHLKDFEDIKSGNSRLDELYEISRQLVSTNIKHLQMRRRELQNQLTQINEIDSRSAELAKRISEYVNRIATLTNYERDGKGVFRLDNETIEDIESAQFWTSFMNAPDDPVLEWRPHHRSTESFKLPRSYILAEFGDPLDTDNWDRADQIRLQEQIRKKVEEVYYLQGADFQQLLAAQSFS